MRRIQYNVHRWSIISFVATIDTLLHGPRRTRINKIHISTRKSSPSVKNSSPSWINTLGDFLLDPMIDSQVCFTLLTNIIKSNTIITWRFRLFWFLCTDKALCQAKNRKRGQKNSEIASTKESIKLDDNPNIFWYSLPTKYRGGVTWY